MGKPARLRWTKNFFRVPLGRIGKSLVEEIGRLLLQYNSDPDWEALALKAVIVVLPLLLQKPSRTSKTKDHKLHLERRLDLWKKGLISKLVDEGKAIQRRILNSKRRAQQDTAKSFCNLILQGKTSAACKLINQTSSGPLEVDDEVLELLKSKHPSPNKGDTRVLLNANERKNVESIIYEEIDATIVHNSDSKNM